jgi:hypothetical protein
MTYLSPRQVSEKQYNKVKWWRNVWASYAICFTSTLVICFLTDTTTQPEPAKAKPPIVEVIPESVPYPSYHGVVFQVGDTVMYLDEATWNNMNDSAHSLRSYYNKFNNY